MRNIYPYTDAHELNLDWILKKIRELEGSMENFEVLNKIRFYGAWDITKQYPAWAIVNVSSMGYISLKPVPAGIDINNTDYWALVADYTALFVNINSVLYNRSYLNNKKVVVYGDSTIYKTAGVTSYMDLVEKIANCTVTNRAVPSTRMKQGTNSGYDLINASNDLTDFDFIFLAYGTNEWQANETPYMIRYDVTYLLMAIQNKNPDIQIVFINPFYSFRDNWGLYQANVNPTGLTLEDVNGIIQNELREHAVPFIDLYHCSSCNEYNYTKLLENTGGVYVHALDVFKPELATLIFKGPVSRENNKIMEPMLYGYDFVVSQNAATLVDYVAGSPNNLCIHLTGGTPDSSTYKEIDNREDTEYIITGTTDEILHIAFAGKLFDTGTGDFEFRFNFLSTQETRLTVGCDNDANVSNLQLYRVAKHPIGISNQKKFGRCIEFKADNVTFTQQAGYHYGLGNITIDHGVFTIASSLAALTTLMHGDSDLVFHAKYGFMYEVGGSGTVYPVQFTANTVKTMTTVPAGTYCLADHTFDFPYNDGFLMTF